MSVWSEEKGVLKATSMTFLTILYLYPHNTPLRLFFCAPRIVNKRPHRFLVLTSYGTFRLDLSDQMQIEDMRFA